MIKTFKSKEAEKIFNRNISRKLPYDIQIRAMRKLWMLNAAVNITDLRVPPSNNLELLRGAQRKYSIRINDQWRICFEWFENNAYSVEIIDYH